MVARHSLSRRVFFTIFFVAMSVVAVFSVVGAFYIRGRMAETSSRELSEETDLVAVVLNEAPDDIALLRTLSLDGARITLIDSSGMPIYDSKSDASRMSSHAERAEVREAFATGSGSSTRQSHTLGESMIYEARLLNDGNVIRLSRQQSGLLSILQTLVLPILTLTVVGFAISFFTAKREANAIIAPLTLVDLDHPKRSVDNAYTEMLPMLERIETQRKELKRQMRVLTNNDRMRREFTANITHELKTPLTAISGYAELIANGMVPHKSEQREFAQRIFKEAGRLTALVNDILTLSNLDEAEHNDEASNAEVLGSRDIVDLPRLMDSVAQRLETVAGRSQVSIDLDCQPAQVTGVPRLLDEMAYNLASNAIRYNRPGGTVTLSCGMEPLEGGGEGAAAPYIRVSDTGIGIPKDEQQKVFERFYRVDKSRSKSRGGTGLGLAIVKHAALFHHAKIELESEPGAGSTFTVRFPPTSSELAPGASGPLVAKAEPER